MIFCVIFASYFLYTLCLGQTNVAQPAIGPIYPATNNNSLLNFTFQYPTNYQFDQLYVRFTIYDFSVNETSNPQTYPFSWVNFTDSNYSLPWVSPSLVFQPASYVVACFEWLQTNTSGLVADTNECVVTRAPINSEILPAANPISTFVEMNYSITAMAYFPAQLPYDQINITSNINGNIFPTWSNLTSQNSTYSEMSIFYFTNLTSNTGYIPCIYYNCSNSQISGLQHMYTQCMNSTVEVSNKASNKVITKLILFIILLIYIFV